MTHYFNEYDDAYNTAAACEENDDEGCTYVVTRFGNRYRIAVYDDANNLEGYL